MSNKAVTFACIFINKNRKKMKNDTYKITFGDGDVVLFENGGLLGIIANLSSNGWIISDITSIQKIS